MSSKSYLYCALHDECCVAVYHGGGRDLPPGDSIWSNEALAAFTAWHSKCSTLRVVYDECEGAEWTAENWAILRDRDYFDFCPHDQLENGYEFDGRKFCDRCQLYPNETDIEAAAKWRARQAGDAL